MSIVAHYGDGITNPTIETAEDLAVWYRRLDFIGYLGHPDDSFIGKVGRLPGLTADAARTMDVGRLKAYDVTRDPSRLAMAVMRHDEPVLVGLPEQLLELDGRPSAEDELRIGELRREIAPLQAEIERLSGQPWFSDEDLRDAGILDAGATA